jgi:pilus assembly protein Flp/PilA
MRLLRAFLADIRGATAVEYGLLAALISVAIMASLEALGGDIGSLFNDISNHMSTN